MLAVRSACRALPRAYDISLFAFPDALGTLSRSYSKPSESHDLPLAHCAPYPKRTHHCGALSPADIGSRVILTGWILPERKMKTINKSFYHLKDSYGTTQLLVDHTRDDCYAELNKIPVESTILVEGNVVLRPIEARKSGNTGAIDVTVDKVVLLNPADRNNMPFLPSNPHNLPNDELRARYRYLDLRRTALSDNIKMRSKVTHIIRSLLHDQEFTEVETPILLRSSPEGAREYLVPARIITSDNVQNQNDPLFYALSQSPQQPKQLLICSGGVDKYFQIAKCFRDEDGRKDRQPEFTQVDIEMAFVSWGQIASPPSSHENSVLWRIGGYEVREVTERLIQTIWKEVQGIQLPKTFNVMTYNEAMSRFGSDKPDTRFGMEIVDISGLLPVNAMAKQGKILECVVVRKSGDSEFIKASKALETEEAVEHIIISESNRRSWLLRSSLASQVFSIMNPVYQTVVNEALKLKTGDDIWLGHRPRNPAGGSTPLGRIRLNIFELAQSRSDFIITKDPHFLWVTEFPLFTRHDVDKFDQAKGRWSSSHHPFTAPMWQDIDILYRGEPEKVRGQHYDLVLNGVEIGGGSVRIHDPAMQDYIFKDILKLCDQEKLPFDQLLHALRCGAPPHGGIALGLDRIMAILCGTPSIRDVIAFPKTASGTDLLFKSPAAVTDTVLKFYGLQRR